MKTNNHFVPGTCNTICDVTGFKVKRSECMVRWDGFVCIPEVWHPRQPQDFPAIIQPEQVISDARPKPVDDVPTVSYDTI